MIDDLLTIEWRGATLHRHPADLCRWQSEDGVACSGGGKPSGGSGGASNSDGYDDLDGDIPFE